MKDIYHSTSKIDGMGVMAGENIKNGSIISRIKGPLKFKINKNKRDALSHPDWVGVKKNFWIDPLRPYKFLNHSCNPAAGVRGVTLIAIKDIKEGEEITIDYSTIEGDNRWEMTCNCGQENCRKIIKSVEFLTPEQFKSIPYIPAYFRKLYIKKNGNKKVYNKEAFT